MALPSRSMLTSMGDHSQGENNHSSDSTATTVTVASSPPPDPFQEGVDNFLSQLKYKKTLQDEDDGKCASILRSPEVSKLMINLFGKNKQELSTETREILSTLENFFKEYIKASRVADESKVKQVLLELLHNPEVIVFQQTLANDPVSWCYSVLPILRENLKKKATIEQLEDDIKSVQLKRRELAKDTAIAKKRLEEAISTRAKVLEKTKPENIRQLKATLEEYKSEADKLEVIRSQRGESVSNEAVSDLLSRFEALKARNMKVKKELSEISANGALPPDITEATRILSERKAYLDSLVEQIANPLDVTTNSGSLNDSVFQN